MGNKCRLVKVDLSRKKITAQKYGVSKAPESILLANGKIVKTLSGSLNTEMKSLLSSLRNIDSKHL